MIGHRKRLKYTVCVDVDVTTATNDAAELQHEIQKEEAHVRASLASLIDSHHDLGLISTLTGMPYQLELEESPDWQVLSIMSTPTED